MVFLVFFAVVGVLVNDSEALYAVLAQQARSLRDALLAFNGVQVAHDVLGLDRARLGVLGDSLGDNVKVGHKARRLVLADRGFVAPGKAADLVIFDPDTIASKPREPGHDLPDGGVHVKREAIGIDYVLVNGAVLLENGEHTGALPGQVIRGPLYQTTLA